MKRLLFSLFFIVSCLVANAQITIPWAQYKSVEPDYSRSTPIVPNYDNYPFVPYIPSETVVTGTQFNAIVIYNSSTGHENTYKLPVIVNNGSVDKIIFNNNGGCVHVGVNNSGYKYYGGKLEYDRDLEAYIALVTISYQDGSWQRFTVAIPE